MTSLTILCFMDCRGSNTANPQLYGRLDQKQVFIFLTPYPKKIKAKTEILMISFSVFGLRLF